MEINWDFIETIAKGIVVIGGMLVSIYQIYTRLPKSRASLTRDLEILKILDKDDPAYSIIRAHVDRQVTKIYQPSLLPIKTFKIHNWPNLFIGLIFLFVFAPWTYSLYNEGSWWGVLTGFLAVGGLGNIGMAFDKNIANRNESTA
ncbi:MAG: hypothetical protein P8179_21550 [Candidatus Thiodiazotropha sp.]